MACGKYGLNSKERIEWDKRGEMAVAIIKGKSVEEVAEDFEITVETLEKELNEIKKENPTVFAEVQKALAK